MLSMCSPCYQCNAMCLHTQRIATPEHQQQPTHELNETISQTHCTALYYNEYQSYTQNASQKVDGDQSVSVAGHKHDSIG